MTADSVSREHGFCITCGERLVYGACPFCTNRLRLEQPELLVPVAQARRDHDVWVALLKGTVLAMVAALALGAVLLAVIVCAVAWVGTEGWLRVRAWWRAAHQGD